MKPQGSWMEAVMVSLAQHFYAYCSSDCFQVGELETLGTPRGNTSQARRSSGEELQESSRLTAPLAGCYHHIHTDPLKT